MDNIDQRTLNGLYLFKALTKDGCEWHGDVFSRKWSECMIVPNEHVAAAVSRSLEGYEEGVDYKKEPGCVWIA